jgi:hypothetical protein
MPKLSEFLKSNKFVDDVVVICNLLVGLVVQIPTLPVLETLKTLVLEEPITLNILLVLPAAVCLIVNVVFVVPPLVISSLSVVYTSVLRVVDVP